MDQLLPGIEIEGPVQTGPFVVVVLRGAPRGKGRPRTRVVGEFATIYTDAKTREYENDLKDAGAAAMGFMGLAPTAEPLSVVITAYMPIPASWSAKKAAAAAACEIAHTSKPDLDNVIKMVDGLNYHAPRFKGDKVKRPIIWMDDAQIVSLQAVKVYSDQPRLEIAVWRWNG